jgi:hypothetical protein
MLKFIRKYQLIILAVGGSLLMVVFLLQPILTRMKPSQLKAKVATLDDGSSFTRLDTQRADVALSLLKRVNPRALGPRSVGGLGLDTSDSRNESLHWLLLVKQAENAGLIGEAGDGAAWLGDIATVEAQIQINAEIQQGLITNPEQYSQRLPALRTQILEIMDRNARLSAANAGGTLDDVYRILAQARGVYRLLASLNRMPTFSDINAIRAAHDSLDAVAVNAALLNSSLVEATLPEPTDEQLQAFFETYKAQSREDNEFAIGYTQPTRIQLAWLTLDKNVFMNAVKVDRVELNKIWRQDREKYPGDFSLERPNLERQYRDDQAIDMMIEADRIIRAQVLAATNGLPSDNGILTLPQDWDARSPKLEDIANTVVERISNQFSISLPTPSVIMIGDRWLNANAIVSLSGGYGSSSYRVGSRQIPTPSLPQFFELTEPNTTGLDVQAGLPLVDPPATDTLGNRYYAVILGVRTAGPAETIADVTREQVLRDYKSVEGYKVLADRADEFRTAIAINDSIAPAINLAIDLAPDPDSVIRPGVVRNILVRRDIIERGALASFVDPRLNTVSFRSAVRSASSGLDPLASPEEVAANPIPVVVALPESKSLALALVIAPRPATVERFRTEVQRVIATTAQRELVDAGLAVDDPFSFTALTKRYGLKKIKDDEDKASEESADKTAAAEETQE